MKFVDSTDFFEKWKLGRTSIKSLIEPDILIPVQRKQIFISTKVLNI